VQQVDAVAQRAADDPGLLGEEAPLTLALVEREADQAREVAPAVRAQRRGASARGEDRHLEPGVLLHERGHQPAQVGVHAAGRRRVEEERVESDVTRYGHRRIVG
jgi:hypothetical protein